MNKSRRLFDIHNKNTFTNNKSYREINRNFGVLQYESGAIMDRVGKGYQATGHQWLLLTTSLGAPSMINTSYITGPGAAVSCLLRKRSMPLDSPITTSLEGLNIATMSYLLNPFPPRPREMS